MHPTGVVTVFRTHTHNEDRRDKEERNNTASTEGKMDRKEVDDLSLSSAFSSSFSSSASSFSSCTTSSSITESIVDLYEKQTGNTKVRFRCETKEEIKANLSSPSTDYFGRHPPAQTTRGILKKQQPSPSPHTSNYSTSKQQAQQHDVYFLFSKDHRRDEIEMVDKYYMLALFRTNNTNNNNNNNNSNNNNKKNSNTTHYQQQRRRVRKPTEVVQIYYDSSSSSTSSKKSSRRSCAATSTILQRLFTCNGTAGMVDVQ